MRRVGFLAPGAPDPPEDIHRLGEPLRRLGWVEGQNLLVERRYANGRTEALQPLAEELVRAKVEVIETYGTAATLAAKRVTTTIPIVFHAGDAILLGIVTNLARPGGNVTGFSQTAPELVAKEVTVLRELLPTLQRIGVLEVSSNPYFRTIRPQLAQVCRSLGLEPLFVEIATPTEIDGSIASFARQYVQVVILGGDQFIYENRFAINNSAQRHRLPTMAEQTDVTREGFALISYSSSDTEEYKRAASFIDRILNGAKPGDLPVEQPTRFELVINLKVANALAIEVPRSLLLRADEVIR